MRGEVAITADGLLAGSLERSGLSHPPQAVRLAVDGRWIADFATRPGFDAEMVQHRLSYQLPPDLSDTRPHVVSLASRHGARLPNSPLIWESRSPLYPDEDVFTLASLQSGATESRSRGVFQAALADGSTVLFDPRSLNRPERGRARQFAENDPVIGRAQAHREYLPWPAFVALLSGVSFDPGYGGVYLDDSRVWQGSKYLSNSCAESFCRSAIRAGQEVKAAPAERCMVFCNSVKDTYFHWHLDCLAGLVMARAMLGEGFTAVGPRLNTWQKASLALLGESPVEWDGLCRPGTTIVPAHLDGRGIFPDRWVQTMFNRILTNAKLPRRRGRGAKLFISREDGVHRVLENETELWNALRKQGFTRFVPGRASYADQIAAFSEAAVVVASHGSALTNIGFCRPGTQVVEILPSDFINGCFRYLAIARRLKHAWYLTPQTDPFRVDVADFVGHCGQWGVFSG